MPRSITGYVFPLPTDVFNSPLLKTDEEGYIVGQAAPNHHILIGGDTQVNSIVGTAGQILISNGASVDPSFVDTSTVPFANIAGGNKNDIVYQFDTDNTDFTPAITLTPEEETLGVTYVLKQAANDMDYPKFTKNLVLGTVTSLSVSAASVTGGAVSGSNLAGLTGAKFISGDITGTLQRGTVLDTTAGGTGNTTGSLAGGAANQIPYQFTNDLTYFTGPGQTGQVLIGTTGAPPSFSNSINGPLSINSTGTIKSTSLESLSTIKGIGIEATTGVTSPSITGTVTVTAPSLVGSVSVQAPIANFSGLMTSGGISTGIIAAGAIGCAAVTAAGSVSSVISVAAPLIDGVNIVATGSIKDTTQARPGGWASMRVDSSGRFLGTDITPGLASEIQGGTAGAVVYQSAPDNTSFVTGTTNQLLQSNGTSAPSFTSTPTLETLQVTNTGAGTAVNISSTSASSELLKLTQSDISTANRLILENTGNVSSGELSLESTGTVVLYSENDILFDATEYSYTNLASASYLSTDAGGKLTVNASFPPASLTADIQGGTAGAVVYQAATDDTAFVTGTSNQLLQSNGSSAPSFTSTPTLQTIQITNTSVNNALNISSTSSSNTLLKLTQADGSTSNRVLFENTSDGTTGELSLEPTGEILLSSSNDIQFDATEYLYTNLASATYLSTDAGGKLTVNASFPPASITSNIQGGAANQIVYQTGVDTTSFVGPGLTNEILVGTTGNPPSFSDTPTLKNLTLENTSADVGLEIISTLNSDTLLRLEQQDVSTAAKIVIYNAATTNFSTLSLEPGGLVLYADTQTLIQSPVGVTVNTPVNTFKLENYTAGLLQSSSTGLVSSSTTIPATTITNAAATPGLIINQNGIGEAIRVTCTTNSAAFVYNIPSGQLYNGLYVQASAAQGNLTYYSAGARISIIGQAASTNNFQVVSDRAVLLQGANGTIVNTPTTAVNSLIWNQNSASKVSSISQEATTGIYAITSDSDIKITPGTSSKTSIVKASTAENKLEFSQNAGAKISSVSQVATTGVLSVKSDTSLKLDAPTYNLTGITSAPFLQTDASSNIIAGTISSLFQKPKITLITASGFTSHALTSGLTYVEVWLCGSGGGGAGGDGSHGGGAGGGGATAYRLFVPTTSVLGVTLGVGGGGGAYTVNGSSGNVSTLSELVSGIPTTRLAGDGGEGGYTNATSGGGASSGSLGDYYINGGTSPYNWHDDAMPGGSTYFTGPQMPVAGSTKGGGGRGGTRYAAGQDGGVGVCLIMEHFT